MARPLRLEVAGGLYHVIVRGNERKAIFRDDTDRSKYLERLASYREKFEFQLLAYCLLDNHVHLAIGTGRAPLSKIMAGQQSAYTQYFNWRHKRVGHLFQGRYRALLVQEDRYALALIRYIHENPVKAGIVEKPEQYVWSSDRFYRRGKGPAWLDIDRVLAMLGRRRSAAVREYRRLMRDEVEEPYEDVPSWGGAIKGDEAFADRVFGAIGEPEVVPRGITIERIAKMVAGKKGLDLGRMSGPSRERDVSRGRLMATWLAREVGRISVARSAKYFGRSGGALNTGVNRLEEEMTSDAGLRKQLERMRSELRGTQ
jgi:REP-associated tyrosine transposase